jgi:hypothetical protein
LTVFFASGKVLVLNAVPKGHKYNQSYFVEKAIPDLQPERSPFAHGKILVEFPAPIGNSMCHNGMKVTNALDSAALIRPRTWSIHQT